MNNVDIFNICLAKKLSGGGGGTYESKSVTPDFSNGDVTVSPDEGYDALSSVTIEKDADLIADNIRKDVNVFGIVGTLEGGGDSQLDALIDRSITHIENSNVTKIGDFVFESCTNLVSVSFPHTTEIGRNAFAGCSSLNCDTSVAFPEITRIKEYTFQGCSSLKSAIFKKVTIIGEDAFQSCSSLTLLDLYQRASIYNYAFQSCSALATVVLRSTDGITTLNQPSALSNSAFGSSGVGGTLYVPQSLIANYQADSRWNTILGLNANNKILPIEGSPYENP